MQPDQTAKAKPKIEIEQTAKEKLQLEVDQRSKAKVQMELNQTVQAKLKTVKGFVGERGLVALCFWIPCNWLRPTGNNKKLFISQFIEKPTKSYAHVVEQKIYVNIEVL